MVILVVGGVVLFKGQSSNKPSSESASPEAQGSSSKSAAELLASGKDQKCTFSRKDDQTDMTGTMYISKGKMRGDFDVTAAGQKLQSHMISDGTTVYNWTSLSNTGFKMAFKPSATVTVSPKAQEAFNVDDKADYNCSNWSADSSKFAMPSGVTFTDFSQMMQVTPATKPGSSGAKTQQCQACDQIPDAQSKAACKTALGC